jgi:hypothetical protein
MLGWYHAGVDYTEIARGVKYKPCNRMILFSCTAADQLG